MKHKTKLITLCVQLQSKNWMFLVTYIHDRLEETTSVVSTDNLILLFHFISHNFVASDEVEIKGHKS